MEGTSLRSQDLACREYARSNKITILKTFVDEGVVGLEEIEHAPTFPHEAVEEHLRLQLHVIGELLVEVGEHEPVRMNLLEVLESEPLAGESGSQRLGT